MEQSLIGGFYGKLKKVNATCATLAGIVLVCSVCAASSGLTAALAQPGVLLPANPNPTAEMLPALPTARAGVSAKEPAAKVGHAAPLPRPAKEQAIHGSLPDRLDGIAEVIRAKPKSANPYLNLKPRDSFRFMECLII